MRHSQTSSLVNPAPNARPIMLCSHPVALPDDMVTEPTAMGLDSAPGEPQDFGLPEAGPRDDDQMKDVIHEPAGEDGDKEMEENRDIVPIVDVSDPIATIEMEVVMGEESQMSFSSPAMPPTADHDMPDFRIRKSSGSDIREEIEASMEKEYLPELPVQATITSECTMADMPTSPTVRPSSQTPKKAVDEAVVQVPARQRPQSKPTPGPNQRIIFNLGASDGQRYRLVRRPAPSDDGCPGQHITERKRKWDGPHNSSIVSLCTLKDVHETFFHLVQQGYSSINGTRTLIHAQEAAVLKPAFMFQLATMTTTRTFTGKGWRTARITTFDDFLSEKAVRPSGCGPWTMEDGIQVIKEYLIYRLPVTNSTHAVLAYLEQRASAILEQVVSRRTACRPSSTRQRTLGEDTTAKQQASSGSFSRAYATPLYHQVQDRLFAWRTSFAPARMGRVDLRALHV